MARAKEQEAMRNSLQKNEYIDEQRRALIEWIHPNNYNDKHEDIFSRRIKDTGKWFLNTPEFKEWVEGNSSSRVLVGCGIPGAGKTFISCGVISHLESLAASKGDGVAYIYFDYKGDTQQSRTDILASIIKQLALKVPQLPTAVGRLYKDSLEAGWKRLPYAEYLKALLRLSEKFTRVFLVFDALDECQENRRSVLLPLFKQLADNGLSILLTSQPHPHDVRSFMIDTNARKIDILAKTEDIRRYIIEKIDGTPRTKLLVQEGMCKDRIITQLVECANGMFSLAHFHINYLCQLTTANKILRELDGLKRGSIGEKSLNSTYERVIERLERQPKDQKELAVTILSWLVFAAPNRVLAVQELRTAVSVEPGSSQLETLDLPLIETLLEVCGSLVTIDGGKVHLAHYSIHNFLKNSNFLKDAKLRIAVACATYLSFNVFTEGPCTSRDLWKSRLKSNPLLQYAAHHLSYHLKSCEESLTTNVLLGFLKRSGNISSYLQAFYANELPLYKAYPKGQTPLHVASTVGHCAVTRQLIEAGDDINSRDKDGSSPLHCAALAGHYSVVLLLLGMGANSDPDKNGRTPLHRAAQKGHETIVNLLLRNGTDLSVSDGSGLTALHQSALEGHENVVALLLENGASLSATDRIGRTPLHCAVDKNRNAVVKVLLMQGASISSTDHDLRTPLHCAASNGNENIVRALLWRGADVLATTLNGWTPLEYAKHEHHERVLPLLEAAVSVPQYHVGQPDPLAEWQLWQDIVINTPCSTPALPTSTRSSLCTNTDGRTLLHLEAFKPHNSSKSIRQLLEEGFDVAALDNQGQTPLHCAAAEGHERMVKLLVENGASVSANDILGKTPLHCAVERGHVRVAKLLLRRDASLSLESNNGWTPLHSAASQGQREMVCVLLQKGADPTVFDNNGFVPMQIAEKAGHNLVANILRNSTRNEPENPLPNSISPNSEIELDLSHIDRAAFKLAIYDGILEEVERLIGNGVDISIPDDSGCTPLHSAAARGHEGIVRELMRRGADASFKDKEGWTAARWARFEGHVEVAEFLETISNPNIISGRRVGDADDWYLV